MGYLYRGRHRKPTATGRRVATLSVLVATPTALTLSSEVQASAHPVDVVISCESGGNPTATNPSSTASGLYQFLDSSWLAYGGGKYASRAKYATSAQQQEIAIAAYNQSGLTPWASSRSCWQDRSAPAETSAPVTHSTGPVDNGGRGTYVCDRAHLMYDACDIQNLGATVAYPPYDGYVGKHRAPEVSVSATVTNGRDRNGYGSYVCDAAHLSFDACDPDTLGKVVQYPHYD